MRSRGRRGNYLSRTVVDECWREVGREKGGKFKKTYMYTYLTYVYILRISPLMMIDTSPFKITVYLGIASNMLFCRQ